MNNIKQLQPKEGVTLLAVLWPGEASELCMPKIGMVDLYFHNKSGVEEDYISVNIPLGPWQLLGTPDQITEDQCSGLFKGKDGYGLSVELPAPNNRVAYFDRKEALKSFLEANEVDQNSAILLKL